MLIYPILLVVALFFVVACDQDAAPSDGTPKTTIGESPNNDGLRAEWGEVGEPALLKELAGDTVIQGWSRYILVGGSSVDSRKMIVIPRAGVTATELRQAFDEANVEIVSVSERIGLIVVQTSSVFSTESTLMGAHENLKNSELFETVALDMELSELSEPTF